MTPECPRRQFILTACAAPLLGLAIGCQPANAPLQNAEGAAPGGAEGDLIAIDVLLEPDAATVERAATVNARLRQSYPQGYALDASHQPHITLLQRFVRRADLEAVSTAVRPALNAEEPLAMPLRITGFTSTTWSGVEVLVYVVELSPELRRLQQRVVGAVQPYAVSGGDARAFVFDASGEINAETIGWVENFVPDSSGENYFPHVTLGVAQKATTDAIAAEPFDSFTFHAANAAIYQLGNFGTAQRRLWSLRSD
jgi:2'-5' RNA ligase